MKFGKLESLEGVNFELPQDHAQTQRLLASWHEQHLKGYHGGTQFGRKEWVGKLYPTKTKSQAFLSEYVRHFNTLELNATHYRIFPPEIIHNWADQAPDNFLFCPKWPQTITHYRRFNNTDEQTDQFLSSMFAFGDKLGPCFIQLPPNYTSKHAQKLVAYLESLPRDLKVTLEMRHPSWFEGGPEAEMTFEALEKLGVGACISDTAGRRDAVHMRITAPFLLIRFGGYAGHPSDPYRLNQWMDRIESWHGKIPEIFWLTHQPESITTPETNAWLAENWMARFGGNLPIPQLIQQTNLFN